MMRINRDVPFYFFKKFISRTSFLCHSGSSPVTPFLYPLNIRGDRGVKKDSTKESKNIFFHNICIALNAFFGIINLTIANALSKM